LSEVHQKTPKPLEPLWKAAREEEDCIWHRVYSLGSKAELLVSVWKEGEDEPYRVVLTTDTASDVVMHWGVRKGSGRDWKQPEDALLTQVTELVPGGKAAETPFEGCTDDECHIEIGGSIVPLQRIEIHVPSDTNLSALSFALRSGDGSRWWKDGVSDFVAPLTQRKKDGGEGAPVVETDELMQRIIDAEVKSGGWTLMHRFNLAADLLDDVLQGRYEPMEKAMATIYVWLRYSATRQLTWQRNYNTQPRILGAAQERLTHKISEVYSKLTGRAKEWARLCLTTVGRGGNAQAVRDEILNIMHRNKISEVKGTWMEEFHQKLHNNTTPDDVGICEAYLAFLRTGGDIGAYWGVLSDHGIDRERLESFDRAIVTLPVFFADKKDALIRDFEHYLGILKATHSGADLQASASAASGFIPSSSKSYLGYVLGQQGSGNILPVMEAAVECRTELNGILGDHRETMYLDLALENVVRSAAERGAGSSGAGAAALMEPLLQNLALSVEDNEEICYCLKAWQELDGSVKRGGRVSKDQALRGMAVVERIQRALAGISDITSNSLQDISYAIGTACGCDDWAVQLFAEEVVRGGPAFAVSLVLTAVEQNLRRAADLGSWQVISPVRETVGKLVVVPNLHDVADTVYDEPTILLAAHVSGEEEPPLVRHFFCALLMAFSCARPSLTPHSTLPLSIGIRRYPFQRRPRRAFAPVCALQECQGSVRRLLRRRCSQTACRSQWKVRGNGHHRRRGCQLEGGERGGCVVVRLQWWIPATEPVDSKAQVVQEVRSWNGRVCRRRCRSEESQPCRTEEQAPRLDQPPSFGGAAVRQL
jgi:alpha-glucan,water dikinase